MSGGNDIVAMENSRAKTTVVPRYLTFTLDEEAYGIPILKVKELVRMSEITPLPQTHPAVRGVINLRGKIIPVVDLRVKFGFPFREYTKWTSIIVLDLVRDGQTTLLGVIVDSIQEVQTIPEERISTMSGFESRIKTRYIQGVGTTPSGIRILVDVDKILTEEELAPVAELTHSRRTE